ncbi:hypothetical protein SAMN05519103_00342 [Rhizobiales bacterium GAS113]|nr:hypothetical protein SAMN05519103_00342 [Rhizobiales bacterium GAS113]
MSFGKSSAEKAAALQSQQLQQQALLLQQQQAAAANDAAKVAQQNQISSIQQSVSVDTWNLLKQFGQRSAMAGANLAVPLSTTTGGFATPVATPSGAPK